MQSSAFGGGVLILANEATAAELSGRLSIAPSKIPAEPAGVRFERVADSEALVGRLALADTFPTMVVLDPELAAPDERTARTLALQMLRPAHILLVVLYADPTAGAMHAVRRLAAHLQCVLLVRGVDPLPVWSELVQSPTPPPAIPREAVDQLARLPSRFRLAWVDAIVNDDPPTVKRVAASACVQRRTLERTHKDAGIWSPYRLLRALIVANQERVALRGTPTPDDVAREATTSLHKRCG